LKSLAPITAVVVFVLAPPAAVFGVERFPPPEFESGYELPRPEYPGPRADLYEYLDVAALAVALALASYLVLRQRSRGAVFVLMLFSLAYFGFWRGGCVCPIGAVQNVSLALFDQSYFIPLTVIAFFILPLLATVLFGRSFCAAVCPLGAIQDVVLVRGAKVPGWLERGLRVLPYLYLGAAVLFAATGSAFIICRYDPFVSFFRLSGGLSMLVLGACLLVIGVFVGRPYCRFVCPYGAVLGLLSRVSWWRVTISPAECVQCRLCEDSCPFGAIQKPTEALSRHERPQSKMQLAMRLCLLPAFVALGVWLGGSLAAPFSRMHARVRLAEQILLEEKGEAEKGATDASEAFRETEQRIEDLYADALVVRDEFAAGGRWLGAFLGLVIGIKLIHLLIRRRREDYEAERAMCLACARCFSYCPVERKRRKEKKESPATVRAA